MKVLTTTAALMLCVALYAINLDTAYAQNGKYSASQFAPGVVKPGSDPEPKVTNGGVNLFPYTAEIRAYIVQAHNIARATLTPVQAANMRELSWNEKLAIEASELVNTCVFEHSTENYAYGQNLVVGNPVIDRPTIDSWMKAWVTNEISQSDRSGNGYMDLDHASAVLWAKSYYVGCASKKCPSGYLTACNYFTQGNIIGEPVFIPGPPCSRCPPQAPFCDASGKLCTANKSGYQPTIQQAPAIVTPRPSIAPPQPAPQGRTPAWYGTVASTPAPTRGNSPSSKSTGDKSMYKAGKDPTQNNSAGDRDPSQHTYPTDKYPSEPDNGINKPDIYGYGSSSSTGSGSHNSTSDVAQKDKNAFPNNKGSGTSTLKANGVVSQFSYTPSICEYVMSILVVAMLL